MKKDNSLYLKDILKSINRIQNYSERKTYEQFCNDYMLQDAIIRNLEIIGEAANKLDIEFEKDNPSFPIKSVIGMRNILIHNYDQINLERTWNTINTNLPELKIIIYKILG